MNVLVAGGAGYIGSHAVKRLIQSGHKVVVVDNLCRGHAQAVDGRAVFHQLALAETAALTTLLGEHRIDCVMHFAALIAVGESVADPLGYYENNTAGTISLLRAMRAAGVQPDGLQLHRRGVRRAAIDPHRRDHAARSRSIPTAGPSGAWSGS